MNLQELQNKWDMENDIAWHFEKKYLADRGINIYEFQNLSYEEQEKLVDIDKMNDYVYENTKQRMIEIYGEEE